MAKEQSDTKNKKQLFSDKIDIKEESPSSPVKKSKF